MGILNYTTKINPLKTATEIQHILAVKGATSVSIDYRDGEPVALSFKIEVRGRDVAFRLPCNWKGVEKALQRDVTIPSRLKTEEQAKRVAWRIVKDWVEAQLAIIGSGQAEMAEVFMPYAITDNGQTLFQRFAQDSSRLLTTSGDASGEGNIIEGKFRHPT